MKPSSQTIRQQFLDFFAAKGHVIVPSSPVVPHGDPTLLFTNAGMNQFKPYFLGTERPKHLRIADTQKCIRAGGKHNDLDDVGRDTYHQTFFEMLGNWSFGDYFKEEAIRWAWELLTEVYGIDRRRLHATYFQGDAGEGLAADDEAARLWREVTDINPDYIHPGNKKDNFWEMGDTGPCGPCSEIHVDLTPDMSGAHLVNKGDARVIELWNLVFIQFNRGNDGKLSPLPAKHVDTGMGFERLCAILNGKSSNYDTDVFAPIFAAIQKRTGAPDYRGTLPGDEERESGVTHQHVMNDITYRVIGDHIRCLVMAITDGAMPSNEGRGYVLRRILRRAVRYGRQYFGVGEPFLCDLVPAVVEQIAGAFPELRSAHGGKNIEHLAEIIRDEESSFGRTLTRGIQLFEEAADRARRHHNGRIAGEDAFKLHDTYGFPIDLTELMAEEQGLHVDIGEYERLMEEARAKAGRQQTAQSWLDPRRYTACPRTQFVGYDRMRIANGVVRALDALDSGMHVSGVEMREGQEGAIVISATPFYAEQGGQVGDKGTIDATGTMPGTNWSFRVESTIKVSTGRENHEVYVHVGRCVRGTIRRPGVETHGTRGFDPSKGPPVIRERQDVSDYDVIARVDENHRRPTMQNHTATHVLNWALREVLGGHVQQKGSLVDPEKTRFDFSHNKPIADEELERIEGLVNEQIAKGLTVYAASREEEYVDQKRALEINTLRAVFGEKYPERVRVVSIGVPIDELLADPKNERWMGYSVEFCGGTHVKNTSEIGRFVLTSEESVAKGVRRVVGVTGEKAEEAERDGTALLARMNQLDKAPAEQWADGLTDVQRQMSEKQLPVREVNAVRERVAELQKRVRQQEKAAAGEAAADVRGAAAELLNSAKQINGTYVIVGEVPHAPADALRGAIDWFRSKTSSSAVLLACHDGSKVTLTAGMSHDVIARGVKAGVLTWRRAGGRIRAD